MSVVVVMLGLLVELVEVVRRQRWGRGGGDEG